MDRISKLARRRCGGAVIVATALLMVGCGESGPGVGPAPANSGPVTNFKDKGPTNEPTGVESGTGKRSLGNAEKSAKGLNPNQP